MKILIVHSYFLLIIVFGSPKIGLLSIFPNIFPAVFGMGIWGFLNGEIDIGVTMAAGVTIGIIVDDTVHFLVKYTKARNEFGNSNIEAVKYALQQVGPALIFTTIVLVTGFVSIATLTNLTFNSHMGLMTAMVLTFALLMTLISLPVLLMNFDKTKINSDEAFEKLANKRLILRKMEQYKIPNSLRLTIGNKQANEHFIQVIGSIIK